MYIYSLQPEFELNAQCSGFCVFFGSEKQADIGEVPYLLMREMGNMKFNFKVSLAVWHEKGKERVHVIGIIDIIM